MTGGGGARSVSLNADIGEGYGAYSIGDDEGLMGVLTDVNIACGFHAGDPSIMRRRVDAAIERGLGIGAHIGYPDLRGFGRRGIDVGAGEVYDDAVYQIGALQGAAAAAGGRVGYVKPHGALYHAAWTDAALADAVARAVADLGGGLALVCPAGSAMEAAAEERGITAVAEGYIDRAYTDEGHLVPRSHPRALVDDPAEAAERALRMIETGAVPSVAGVDVPLRVETLCVHSDSPGAATLARAVRDRLRESGIDVRSFGRD